jgi:hypothetical protein
MGAIKERLDITLQDVRSWLRISWSLTGDLVVTVLSPVVVGQVFTLRATSAAVDFDRTYSITAASTSANDIAVAMVAAIISDHPVGQFSAVALGNGKYKLTAASPFDLIFSRGQKTDPQVNQSDLVLSALLSAALDMADEYCNNEFLDDSGEPETIPDAVRLGVLQIVDALYMDYVTSSAATSGSGAPAGPVKSKKAGDLQVTYATPSEMSAALGARGLSDLPSFVQTILAMYRFHPGNDAPRAARTAPPGLSNQPIMTDTGETSDE